MQCYEVWQFGSCSENVLKFSFLHSDTVGHKHIRFTCICVVYDMMLYGMINYLLHLQNEYDVRLGFVQCKLSVNFVTDVGW